MTVIIGHCLPGKVFLAADTRRRDRQSGRITEVQKLHRLSDNLLVAQGGAGSGAADEVLKVLFLASTAHDIDSAVKASVQAGPSIMGAAAAKWAAEGRSIPPTKLVFAAIVAGRGQIRAVDLSTGDVTIFSDNYCAGSDGPAIMAMCGKHFVQRLSTGKAVDFDGFCLDVASELERTHGQDIGLPVDLGCISTTAAINPFETLIVRATTVAQRNPAFSFAP